MILRRWCSAVLFNIVVALPATAAVVHAPDFVVETVATELHDPTCMAFAPDGRLFVTERHGTLRVIENGLPADPPFATIAVYSESENGLLSVAIDPDFETNHYVYVFATISNSEQQVLRLRDDNGVGVEQTIIKQHLPTIGNFHSGGGLKFGPDGKLYFSVGDNQNPDLAQDMNSLAGKVCRINKDGATPADNPFHTGTGAPRSIYALGFRSPFRFCFAPDGRLFVMDVGSNGDQRQEEINLVHAGDNCGWPTAEGPPGPAPIAGLVYPIYAYHDKGASPVGGVYYTGDQYPAQYQGNLFHIDYIADAIFRVELNGDSVVSHTMFVKGEDGMLDLTQGPDGSLYYCELVGGKIRRVRSTAASGTTGGSTTSEDMMEDDGNSGPRSPCGAGAELAFFAVGLTLSAVSARSRRRMVR